MPLGISTTDVCPSTTGSLIPAVEGGREGGEGGREGGEKERLILMIILQTGLSHQ